MYRASGRKIDCLEKMQTRLAGYRVAFSVVAPATNLPQVANPQSSCTKKIVFVRITVTGISNYELRLELLNSANKLASPPLSASRSLVYPAGVASCQTG